MISPAINLISKLSFVFAKLYIFEIQLVQDLIVAVEKINSCLEMKVKGQNYILQDEISSMDLGNVPGLI